MNGTQIVRAIMKEEHVTQTQLAVLLGLKGQTNVSEVLRRDIKASILAKYVDALGYELIVRKKKPGRREADCYLVGLPDPEMK